MVGRVTAGASPSSNGVLTDCSSGQLSSEDELLFLLSLPPWVGGGDVLMGGEGARGAAGTESLFLGGLVGCVVLGGLSLGGVDPGGCGSPALSTGC